MCFIDRYVVLGYLIVAGVQSTLRSDRQSAPVPTPNAEECS